MRVTAVIFLGIFLLTSCNQYHELPEYGRAAPSPTPVIIQRPPEKIDHELERAIAEIAQSAKGKVGVGALMLETGDAAYLDRNGHYAMQSVYKLPIAMAAAQLVDRGSVKFDSDISIKSDDYVRRGYHSPIRNLNPQGTLMRLDDVIRYSLSESDGSANDVLLDLAGGPANVQQYLTSIGVSNIVVADSTKAISFEWDAQYRNYASPDASVKLLTALLDRQAGLSEKTTALIYESMLESETGRRRIRRGLPSGATLAHKTGTGGRPSEVPGYKRPANANADTATSSTNSARNSAETKSPTTRTIARSALSPTQTPKRGRNGNSDDEFGGEIADETSKEVTSATNDIGIITLPDGRHIILAIYIQDSTASGYDRERVMTDIAKAVCDRWTTGQLPDLSQYPLR